MDLNYQINLSKAQKRNHLRFLALLHFNSELSLSSKGIFVALFIYTYEHMLPLKKKEQSNAGRIQGPQEVGPSAFAAGFSTSLQSSFGQGRHLSAKHKCCLLQPEYRQCKRKPPTNTLFYSMLEKLLSLQQRVLMKATVAISGY